MVSLEKWMILTPFQKLPKNGEDWGKLFVSKGFKKLPKVQNIAQSGHTAWGEQSLSTFVCCIFVFNFSSSSIGGKNKKVSWTRRIEKWKIDEYKF